MERLSVIISVYSAVEYTRMVLETLNRQSLKDFEIIIGDDGSAGAMKEMVEEYSSNTGHPLRYLWQPDEGFRKTRMLNRAVKESKGDYLVFVDGDCILHKDFLREHWENREKGVVLCGRRVVLGKVISDNMRLEDIRSGAYERTGPRYMINALLGRISHAEKGMHIRNSLFQAILKRQKTSILGSNFSLYKYDILSIGGFNEEYTEPGYGEDCDIEHRLLVKGVRLRQLKNVAIQYHLYHSQNPPGKKSYDIYSSMKKRI